MSVPSACPVALVGPFLTTKEAAKYCGMPTQSLYNRISKGTGPAMHKHGTRNKFIRTDLDVWMTHELDPASIVAA